MRLLNCFLFLSALTFNINAQPIYSTLYTFQGAPDGSNPSPLTRGPSGALYGTTYQGGTNQFGTVFQVLPPAAAGGAWTESVLYSFAGGMDGSFPQAAVFASPDGTLFGTTGKGGVGDRGMGFGTIFALVPPSSPGGPWTKHTLHIFQGTDGAVPIAKLVLAPDGSLLGTTVYGGSTFSSSSEGYGTVFQLTRSGNSEWTFASIYSFVGENGKYPVGTLAVTAGGALFGVSGTITGNGLVFQLTPPAMPGGSWSEDVIYSFSGSPDGYDPLGGVIEGTNGALYGTTGFGGSVANGGTVYALTPPASAGGPWTETVLHSFGSKSTDAQTPEGELLLLSTGQLIGACSQGGLNGWGALFALEPPGNSGSSWKAGVIHTFDTTGGFPVGPLIHGADKLLGTTDGTVYELTPAETPAQP